MLTVRETINKLAVLLRLLMAVLLVVTYVPFVSALLDVGVIPTLYSVIAIIVSALVVIWTVATLVIKRGKRWRRWVTIAFVVAVLGCILNVYLFATLRATNNLLSSARQDSEEKYIDYAIIAKKDAGVRVDTAKTVAVADTDPALELERQALAEKTPATVQVASDVSGVTSAVDGGAIELGSLRQASLQLVKENQPDLYKRLVVLATFRVKDTTTSNVTTAIDARQPFILYISGIDTYGQISTVSRSDVNMLAVVNPVKHSILLVNTPRDYYVQLHGTTGTRDKLTHAGVYGADMSRQTLEDLYGVTIPYYARVNFTSFVTLIDTIGPIDVVSDYDFKSFRTGTNTLDSKRALEFARERYSFSDGDRQRGKNQQRVIEAVLAKLSQPENAAKAPQIINSLQGSVDTNMPETFTKDFIKNQLDDLKSWSVSSVSVDGSGAMLPTYSYGSQPLYVMIPNEASLAAAKQAITSQLQK